MPPGGGAPPGGYGGGMPGGLGEVRLPPGVNAETVRAVSATEGQDFGIRPTAELHTGPAHGPTPTLVPGARTIDTLGLASLMMQPTGPVVVLDALGGPQRLPNALPFVWATQGQSFDDEVQQRLGAFIQQATNGARDVPIVTYCLNPQCWMSYNVALRLVRLGYRNVLWYRGGIESWQRAGLPLQPMPQMR